jgi:putative FmdB family regulatory protein
MPLYEYECDACRRRFEVIQKFSDEPLTTCEECGGHLRKLVSSPAIQFKGSGWYITDYARAGKSDSKSGESKSEPTAAADAKSEPKSSGGAETKTESKPAPKSESAPATSRSKD